MQPSVFRRAPGRKVLFDLRASAEEFPPRLKPTTECVPPESSEHKLHCDRTHWRCRPSICCPAQLGPASHQRQSSRMAWLCDRRSKTKATTQTAPLDSSVYKPNNGRPETNHLHRPYFAPERPVLPHLRHSYLSPLALWR